MEDKKINLKKLSLPDLWRRYQKKNIKGKATLEDVRSEVNELIRRIGEIAEKNYSKKDE